MDELLPTFVPVEVDGKLYFAVDLPSGLHDVVALIHPKTGAISYETSNRIRVHPQALEYLNAKMELYS